MPVPDMSSFCKQYIRSLLRGDLRTAYHHLSLVSTGELCRALAVPSREDIKDLFEKEPEQPVGVSSEIPGVSATSTAPYAKAALAAASLGARVLERQPELIYAYKVVESGKLKFAPDASPPDKPSQTAATDYVHHCVAMRDIPLELDDDDYSDAADTLGVDVNALKAVAQVESAGSGFGDDGRPIIRYELHIFQENTQRQFHKTHPYLSQPNWHAGDRYHDGTQDREYSLLYNAMLLTYRGDLAVEEAIESASWGKFQIMGDNWSDLGWSSALDFASDMYASEANQLDACVKFIQFKGIASALKKHHWATFALHFNGSGYKDNDYDGRLQRAFDRLQHAHPVGAHP